MTWQVEQRSVANATSATVRGRQLAGGVQLLIDVQFTLREWPWNDKGPLALLPQPSQVTARFGQRNLDLGLALPSATSPLTPALHSTDAKLTYTLPLSTSALTALETARDGGAIALVMQLAAHPIRLARHNGYAENIEVVPTYEQHVFQIPKEEWLAVLESTGFSTTLLIELALPSTGTPADHLALAVAARNEGRYGDAVAKYRVAVEALDNAPKEGSGELERILKGKRSDYSDRDRFVVLRTAAQIFASPAHHGAIHYQREDAELAIAMTAALSRLAPRWSTPATDATPASPDEESPQ